MRKLLKKKPFVLANFSCEMTSIRNLVIVALLMISCAENDSRQITKMLRREVVLPEVSMIQYTHVHDSHDGRHIQLTEKDIDTTIYLGAKYKIIMYLDPEKCISCSLDLARIQDVILYFKDIFPEIEMLLYIYPDDENKIKRKMQIEHYHYPVFMDTDGRFKKSNTWLPKDQRFHTFLVDKLNRIVAVGSPLNGESIVTLYQRSITKLESNGGLLEEYRP